MKYKIILPNGQTIIFQRVSLRFESSSTELLIFGANEVGGQETLIGAFPYGVSLIDCTLEPDEEFEALKRDYNRLSDEAFKNKEELRQLKSRNLWQRILNK